MPPRPRTSPPPGSGSGRWVASGARWSIVCVIRVGRGPTLRRGGSAVTIEPGGQLELSSAVGASLTECMNAVAGDVALVRAALAEHGLHLDGTGLDAVRRPRLVTNHPRYVALAEYHDRSGTRGRTVMTNSASIQVCLDSGTDENGSEADEWSHFARRW